MAMRNRRSMLALAGVVMLMAGAAWASVPLYDWFCRVTGFGGATVAADTVPDSILERTVLVRFDASLERNMPWKFRPAEREIEVRLGESVIMHYEASNPTSQPIAGTASFNVFPFTAGGYFVKLDCFCFQEQVLQPGETVLMPVNFYIDPEIIDHPEAGAAATITLSYTFHRTEMPEEVAAADTPALTGQTYAFEGV
ncbi:MAG: cytochrome c oxidase assembly protein [Rhodobacteraceae bacterium]|nr:cytochrome c oxidase assembly protein [Paracoccaceae bacterium]